MKLIHSTPSETVASLNKNISLVKRYNSPIFMRNQQTALLTYFIINEVGFDSCVNVCDFVHTEMPSEVMPNAGKFKKFFQISF